MLDRNFAPLLFGNLASNVGNWLFNVTAAVVVFDLTGSALAVGMVSVAQFVPLVVFAPWAGALSDRMDRRRLLLGAQVLAGTSASVLAVAVVLLGADGLPGAWPLMAAAFGIGLGNAVAQPALNSLVPALVEPADLGTAVSLMSLSFNVGRAAGPAAAGLFLVTGGPEPAFVFNALSFAVLILGAAAVQPIRPREPGSRDRSMRGGLQFVRQDRISLLLLLGSAAAGLAADPVVTLAPALAATLDGGDALVATIASVFGLAAIPGALISGRMQNRFGGTPVAGAGMAMLGIGWLIAAPSPVAAGAVAGFAVAGVGYVLAVTSFTTLLQQRVPDAVRGRVMALWAVAFLGNRPLAAAVNGATADLVGPRLALLVSIVVAFGGAAIAWHIRGQYRLSLAGVAEGDRNPPRAT